jgi:hypothetical protein
MQWQDFHLAFANPGMGHRLEFRTVWMDVAYVCEDHVEVQRAAP